MKRLAFPNRFSHSHPPVQDVNEILEKQETSGERAADWLASAVGSWRFIIIQSVVILIWMILNITAWVRHWDPYPFILMNLVLSMQAALTAPVIMMSQNRQSNRDRLEAQNDFQINLTAEEEIRLILEHLEAQDKALVEIYQLLTNLSQNDNGL
ncbi:MAG: DUF1003 domain-containing protein [Anaerolineales bacterium]|nr:DUF1003 domain-containing protein [Anaerolineales bacterium]